MLNQFGIYVDAGLTTPLTSAITFTHNADGSTGDIDTVIYIGSPTATATLQASSAPGVDQITLTISDPDAAAGTPEVTNIKLALSALGLASAVAGAALDLGVTINGGVANAVAVYIRGSLASGNGSLLIDTNSVDETA